MPSIPVTSRCGLWQKPVFRQQFTIADPSAVIGVGTSGTAFVKFGKGVGYFLQIFSAPAATIGFSAHQCGGLPPVDLAEPACGCAASSVASLSFTLAR
jgi:hypothetical protein